MDSAKREVTTERLQDLLQTITRHFSADQIAMRKSEAVLLHLIGILAKREVRKNERDGRRELHEKAEHRTARKLRS